jgi:pimeloyl-ACP methyl ester carboxylesterase
MDLRAAKTPNHGTVLLHGKNFCAATWHDTIAVLVDAGYRVIAPDQIGLCKSTKPAHYHSSLQQLAGQHRIVRKLVDKQ